MEIDRTTVQIYLTLLNVHLDMVRMISFMLRIFYHNKERHWRRLVKKITLVAARFGGAAGGREVLGDHPYHLELLLEPRWWQEAEEAATD